MTRLVEYTEAETLEAAEQALDRLAASDATLPTPIGDLYDELAEIAADEEDFSLAARVQTKAIESGCQHMGLAHEMLGWYLLKCGRTAEGEQAFSDARRAAPTDASVLMTMAAARADAGHHDAALAAHDEAVALAQQHGPPAMLDRARIERRAYREEQGLPADAQDRLAPRPRPAVRLEQTTRSVAWFPPGQREEALRRWPALADDLEGPGYDRRIEGHVRSISRDLVERATVAPIDVDELDAFARAEGLDPDTGEARSQYAADVARRGDAIPWPPGRNDACWCRSGRKYKRCCGAD